MRRLEVRPVFVTSLQAPDFRSVRADVAIRQIMIFEARFQYRFSSGVSPGRSSLIGKRADLPFVSNNIDLVIDDDDDDDDDLFSPKQKRRCSSNACGYLAAAICANISIACEAC